MLVKFHPSFRRRWIVRAGCKLLGLNIVTKMPVGYQKVDSTNLSRIDVEMVFDFLSNNVNLNQAQNSGVEVMRQAVQLDNTLYVSGVLGLDKDTMKLVDGGASGQARQALVSLGHILEAAGTSYKNVVKSTIFLNDINDFAAVNEVYKEFFTENFPARSTYQVGQLPMSAKVEIEVIAAAGDVVQKSNL